MPSPNLSRDATAILPSPATHSGLRPLQRYILPSTAPQRTSTPPHLRRVPHQQHRANAQTQTNLGNSLPPQTHIPPATSGNHIPNRQFHARMVPRHDPTPVSDAEEFSMLSIEQVLLWMSDSSDMPEELDEQIEMSDSSDMEIETVDATHYGCTPAAEHAIEFLAPVLAPDDAEVEDCAICMDEMCPQNVDVQIAKLPCSHLFHGECIMKWLCNHNTCPLCRFQLPSTSDE